MAANENDDFLSDSPEQLAAKRAHFAQLGKLVTSTVLGTDTSQGRHRDGVVRPDLQSDAHLEHRRCARATRSEMG